jgi:hypothetical protein
MVASDRFQLCRHLLVEARVRLPAEGAGLGPVGGCVEQTDVPDHRGVENLLRDAQQVLDGQILHGPVRHP